MPEKIKPTSTVIRNARLLWILSFVEEFRRDVERIRGQFNINPKNFTHKDNQESSSLILDWFEANHEHCFSGDLPVGFITDERPRPFWNEVQKLGEKYKLQYNFFNNAFCAVPFFIFTGKVVAPARNWSIDNEFRKDGGSPRWFSIKIYAPLLQNEVMEGYTEAENHFKQNIKLDLPERSSKGFEKLLEHIDILVVPKQKSLEYDGGRYHEIWIGNTIAEVAKEAGMTQDVLEKQWGRLDNFAKKAFNYGLKKLRH
jgi:hypothetical protein